MATAMTQPTISILAWALVHAQGRMLVAPHLRELAALDREIVMHSSIHWVEVWDKERYDTQFAHAVQQWAGRGGE